MRPGQRDSGPRRRRPARVDGWAARGVGDAGRHGPPTHGLPSRPTGRGPTHPSSPSRRLHARCARGGVASPPPRRPAMHPLSTRASWEPPRAGPAPPPPRLGGTRGYRRMAWRIPAHASAVVALQQDGADPRLLRRRGGGGGTTAGQGSRATGGDRGTAGWGRRRAARRARVAPRRAVERARAGPASCAVASAGFFTFLRLLIGARAAGTYFKKIK